ncbi:AbrB/MazE/SpoVT family DNA-binding domain-containing protein [Clostridium algidicarnis]|uniref:AbrB/MazE/SpoVT family DNA-binding domain-containing protein n=1 Tax=Clostridium algidicarnis TaxID=37659 RepID=UPI001C0D2474|nr:AbrB/MazE/SpoVT family DNA-binding domain-containing protein [Clostridium algidicarnis]MBU3205171.1 AbrB/MazE/SpoVT family DNA-binding domain-containing protein [Clostridium algidicarnis]MBU3213324.1 AbrB/MazE/SpoVT family DNA-binding domain-containing protein [Clostridium algidicarnis]MBU3223781.1 AbrB/MazE/SpoVT family DNA-binding domain-containing protein [Clostridium algidicarnis]
MKSTGIVRKVDQLGRLVLPKELRKVLSIKDNETPLEIYTEGETIILKKYEPACTFCGEASEVINFKGKNICRSCLKELKR